MRIEGEKEPEIKAGMVENREKNSRQKNVGVVDY